jgi:dTDP-4-dehydrorhamnose reductase
LGLDGNTAVLRLTKVMGPEMPLLKRWHEELTAGKVITAFHDTTIAPIAVTFAARMIHEIISRRTEGIFHASGDEDLPYTALAEELIRAMNLGPEMVEAREGRVPGHPSEDSPRYTTLDMSGEREVFGITAPSSRATMAEAADLIARQGPPA